MRINVAGVATTEFGELWKSSPRDLAREAMAGALKDAKFKAEDIDALFVGNMLAGMLGNQANLGSLFVEELGKFVPAHRIEAACALGGLALHNAINSILSGENNTV